MVYGLEFTHDKRGGGWGCSSPRRAPVTDPGRSWPGGAARAGGVMDLGAAVIGARGEAGRCVFGRRLSERLENSEIVCRKGFFDQWAGITLKKILECCRVALHGAPVELARRGGSGSSWSLRRAGLRRLAWLEGGGVGFKCVFPGPVITVGEW